MNRISLKIMLVALMTACLTIKPQEAFSMSLIEKAFQDPQVIQLAYAVQNGDLERIKIILRKGTDVRAVGKQGFTISHIALHARKNAPQVMKMILDAGADPVSVLSDGNNVPHYAVSRDNADAEVVKVLLDHGISANWFPPENTYQNLSMLQAAVMGHNLSIIKLLIERGANINYINPFQGSALHYALNGTDFFMAAYLVEAGIDLSLKNSTSPKIKNPNIKSETALEYFCRFEGGKRGADPDPDILAGWRAFTAALAKRGVTMPCGL